MSHVLTVGDLFWPAVIIGSGVAVVIVIAVLLGIFADAFKH